MKKILLTVITLVAANVAQADLRIFATVPEWGALAKEIGGDKVKVTIMLRGREISRPIGGVELLQRLADDVEEYGTVESKPKQEGRNIIMTLAPKGKKVHTQSEQRRRGDQSRAERQARQAARLAAKQEAQAQAAAAAKAAVASDKPKTSETK